MKTCRLHPCLIALQLVAAWLLTACETPPSPRIVRADALYDLSPNVSADEIGALVAGNNAFAFDLYQTVRAQDGNLVLSPVSISQAFAMVYVGARGETEQEMAEVLHFSLPQDRLHPVFNATLLSLEAMAGSGNEVRIANSLWGQQDFSFEQSFLSTLAINYDAGLQLVDFVNARQNAAQAVNDWVSQNTEGRITDLVQPERFDEYTRLLLVNAMSLKADWLHAFPTATTTDNLFYLLNGGTVMADMMDIDQAFPFRYARFTGFQAIELPYTGDRLAMLILMPDEGEFSTVESWLDTLTFKEIGQALTNQLLAVKMPRFEFETNLDGLPEILQDMGMVSAFSTNADFFNISHEGQLAIDDVFHGAFIQVDENGTQAAAATSVEMREVVGTMYTYVIIDHPFIFIIHDRQTGTILFIGRVLDPAQ